MGQLDGQIAFVTGGASGIGRAIAERFSVEGATVFVCDLTIERAQAIVDGLDGHGFAVQADVSRSADVAAAFAEVAKRFDHLNILVNSAGVAEGAPGERDRWWMQTRERAAHLASGSTAPYHWDLSPHITDESWQRMIGIHLSGSFYCCRSANGLLRSAGSGAVINISSVGALIGTPGLPHYNAAKAGMLALTRSLATELGSYNIRVNAILPGLIETPMTDAHPVDFKRQMLANQPIARVGQASDIAATALFLCSDQGSYYTGQALSPNGGMVMFS